jgi:hypothetical protein
MVAFGVVFGRQLQHFGRTKLHAEAASLAPLGRDHDTSFWLLFRLFCRLNHIRYPSGFENLDTWHKLYADRKFLFLDYLKTKMSDIGREFLFLVSKS